MGGSMGAGHIGLLIKFLLLNTDGKVNFAVICGSNKSCLQAFPINISEINVLR